MFRKILALHDFSPPSKNALDLAMRLAQANHSDLKIQHVVFQTERIQVADDGLLRRLMGRMRSEIDKELNQRGIKQSDAGIPSLEIEITDGETVPTLLRAMESEQPDLVVLGTHGWTDLSHVLLGSVAEKIVRHSPCPVWVARKQPRLPLRKVLVPVDLTDHSKEALNHAVGLSQIYPDLEVELLHVVQFSELVGYFPEAYGGHGAVDLKALEGAAKSRLIQISEKYPELRISTRVRTGQAAVEIQLAALEGKADLILLATHGRTGLGHLLMGSVAEQVVRYAPCDVLSFCPQDAIAPRLEMIRKIRTE